MLIHNHQEFTLPILELLDIKCQMVAYVVCLKLINEEFPKVKHKGLYLLKGQSYLAKGSLCINIMFCCHVL